MLEIQSIVSSWAPYEYLNHNAVPVRRDEQGNI